MSNQIDVNIMEEDLPLPDDCRCAADAALLMILVALAHAKKQERRSRHLPLLKTWTDA